MIISRTPFRVSFFGGGTDYPPWYLEHGGAVIGTAINKYCYLTVRNLPPFFEHKHRIVYSKVE
jgi:D-glycero-alpha-D-manno-heptose-7-phosphate kinase